MGSKLPRRTVGCSSFIANARQPQGGHELGFSLGNSHIQLVPKRHVTPTRSVLPCRSVQVLSFAVIVDFVCVFRSIWPQAHRCVCLMQETSNSTFSSTNTLFDQTVRVWIVGASCGVKDSGFSQPAVHCAHKLSSFIAVETPNSTQQQLHVYHRFFDRLTALVCQRLDETKTCFSSQCNHQIL